MENMIDTYKVYVKTDENSIITAVNSSAFISDLTGWTEIDEGSGDRFHHAQGNYLADGLMDERGLYNYKLFNGAPVPRTDEDKQPEVDKLNAAAEIAKLKAQLAATDYIAAKLAEVAGSEEEYAKIKEEYAEELAHRAYWRSKINDLETGAQ